MEEEKAYRELFSELETYERSGVGILLEGRPASPQQVVAAHMLCEDSSYMRDYVLNEDGRIRELGFTHLDYSV